MEKFDNYIFNTICEKSYELYIAYSQYSTYNKFCDGLCSSIMIQDFSEKDKSILAEIIDYLILIYGMSYEETITYLFDYFIKKKYLVFEQPVKLIRECFKNSLN